MPGDNWFGEWFGAWQGTWFGTQSGVTYVVRGSAQFTRRTASYSFEIGGDS